MNARNRIKPLLTLCCALLLVAAGVFGTLAYLTGTDTVNNTFTVAVRGGGGVSGGLGALGCGGIRSRGGGGSGVGAGAAGGQAQNEKRSQQGRDKAKLFQEMHPFGSVRPCLSQKVIRNRKTAPGQAQENSGVESAQCC